MGCGEGCVSSNRHPLGAVWCNSEGRGSSHVPRDSKIVGKTLRSAAAEECDPNLKSCVLRIQFGEVLLDNVSHIQQIVSVIFPFNTLFLDVLVAGDGQSTAARCGFWKPLSLHPPTAHSGLYIVASANYFLLHLAHKVLSVRIMKVGQLIKKRGKALYI